MTKKKRFISIISVTVLVALIFSLGSFTVGAQANEGDFDVNGVHINDLMEDFVDEAFEDWFECQTPNNNWGTVIFIDQQLLEYSFLDYLLPKLCEYTEIPMSDNENAVLNELYTKGVRLVVHYDEFTFLELTTKYYDSATDTEYCEAYDFSTYAGLNSIAQYVNNTYMCAFTIYEFDEYLYSLLVYVQNLWNDDMPVYVIERDPIPLGNGELIMKIYNPFLGGGSGGFSFYPASQLDIIQ